MDAGPDGVHWPAELLGAVADNGGNYRDYWSSSMVAESDVFPNRGAWSVYFISGEITWIGVGENRHDGARCVRGHLDGDDDASLDDDTSNEDTWTDPTSGLMWQNTSFACHWEEAEQYCDILNWAGYNDWRVPTISELRTLIRGCSYTEPGGECGVTDSCLDLSCFGSGWCDGCIMGDGPGPDGSYLPSEIVGGVGYYLSSSEVADDTSQAWEVHFGAGWIRTGDKDRNEGLRCVRNHLSDDDTVTDDDSDDDSVLR